MGGHVSSTRPCNPDTLVRCTACEREMHRGARGSCREGHLRHGGHGMCTGCTTAARRAGELKVEPEHDELIRVEWPHFGVLYGYTPEQFAERLGVPVAAVRRVVGLERAESLRGVA